MLFIPKESQEGESIYRVFFNTHLKHLIDPQNPF